MRLVPVLLLFPHVLSSHPSRYEHGRSRPASVSTMCTSEPCTTLAWMKTTSPVGTLLEPTLLWTSHLSTINFTTCILSESLRKADFVLFDFRLGVFLFQSPQRLPRPSWAHQEPDNPTDLVQLFGPLVCEPPASMFRATRTNSRPGPCVTVSSTFCRHALPLDETSCLRLLLDVLTFRLFFFNAQIFLRIGRLVQCI